MSAPLKRKGGGPHRHASKSDGPSPQDAAGPYSAAELGKMNAGFGRAMAREGRKPTMVSVFDGRRFLGTILPRGIRGYEALDANKKSLGLFSTQVAAADAISTKGF
jgi:hypothetical protein